MGDPIQNISGKITSLNPVAEKKKKPLRCREDEMVYKKKSGKEVCIFNPLSGLKGNDFTGGVTSVGVTLDQALEELRLRSEAEAAKTKYIPPDTITQTAVYECGKGHYVKGFIPYGVEGETEREVKDPSVYKEASVTVRIIPGESTKATNNRFEKAAEIELRGMKFRGESSDCSSFRFLRFLPVLPKIAGSR